MSLADIGITKSDFEDAALADFGISVTVTPVTATEDFRGNQDFSDGTPYSDTVVFIQQVDEKLRERFGITEGKASLILYKITSNIAVGDKISIALGDGTYVFKVYNQMDRNSIYRVSELHFWEDG